MHPICAPAHFVVLDACVLMSGVLRPALLQLAAAGRFLPLWSERIGQEWQRNAARLWDIPAELLQQEWLAMQQAFPAADAGDTTLYEAGLRYSDRKDHHVIAAGLAGRARSGAQLTPEVTVLTWNLKDFNRSELKRQGLNVCDPDRLLCRWWQDDPALIFETMTATLRQLAEDGRARTGTLPEVLRKERLYRLARQTENTHPAPGDVCETVV